ncbi:envelope membrane protein [Stanieria cyanosphaera PCC 7437]|uniref:Proton extrusion protein PxcA n=1 Tax=Stanieria cyanosphaera (strain ATCC 29371 / PCC 7437) TaxID=111780 RepID=K9XNY8_STAC7|nr:envelope membrane protein [Stanieria cyanosphaera]AFZ34330.1 envelope membrane protein [Stanieria cyanosphaera PCC 7437]
MKKSLSKKNKEIFLQKISSYSQSSYRWLIATPERALNKAYQAALQIQFLEADYLAAQQQIQATNNYKSTIIECLQSDLEQYLAIIKINLAEFKVSRFLLNSQNSNSWEKLVVIDEVLKKYRTDIVEASVVEPINTLEKSNSPTNYASVQDEFINVQSTTEKTEVLPRSRSASPRERSLSRSFQRIKTDFNNNSEAEILQNFRRSRWITQTAIRCILLLIIIPLLTQQLSKEFLLLPLVEEFRASHNAEIFINNDMKQEAFRELQIFEEGLKFQSLLGQISNISPEATELKLKEKANELAEEFSYKSNVAISNVFADLLGLIAFAGVVLTNQQGIIAVKSFLDSMIYNLSDSAKAFIIIMLTDIFVGFHSPHGWEIIMEGVANHLGIQPNRSAIFLFIATFPVILDTIFKYWIFRYLNRISPSAVATLKNMNE